MPHPIHASTLLCNPQRLQFVFWAQWDIFSLYFPLYCTRCNASLATHLEMIVLLYINQTNVWHKVLSLFIFTSNWKIIKSELVLSALTYSALKDNPVKRYKYKKGNVFFKNHSITHIIYWVIYKIPTVTSNNIFNSNDSTSDSTMIVLMY